MRRARLRTSEFKGTLAIYDSSAGFGFEVPTQTRGYNDRNFKSTALGRDPEKLQTFRARSCDQAGTGAKSRRALKPIRPSLNGRRCDKVCSCSSFGRLLLTS